MLTFAKVPMCLYTKARWLQNAVFKVPWVQGNQSLILKRGEFSLMPLHCSGLNGASVITSSLKSMGPQIPFSPGRTSNPSPPSEKVFS